MKKSVFEYSSYKRYLIELIESQPKGGRGVRSALAEAVGCKIAYVSQVLGGNVDFNLEQAGKVNRFFGHSKAESHFFMLMVQKARANDHDTRMYFEEQIQTQLENRKIFSNRLNLPESPRGEDQMTYYSTWYFAAVHILLTIPGFQTKQAIAQRLGLSISRVNSILEFLVQAGLAEERGAEYVSGKAQIHIGREAGMLIRHHQNWRLQALRSIDSDRKNDFHYTAVASLSVDAVKQVKAILSKSIEDSVQVITQAKEERLCAFAVDFFEV